MKHSFTLTLLTALLLVRLAALHAADAPISHRVLCTDYQGNRVVILSAKGDIEWEFPAKTPQDCWMLPNGNVLFSQITGAAEVTMDMKVVWEYQAPAKALVHSCQPLPDGNVLVAECVTGRLVVVGRDLFGEKLGGGIKGGIQHGATDELGFHAIENRHYITDIHATVLHQLGLDSRRLEIPGRKRLDMDHGEVIREIIA